MTRLAVDFSRAKFLKCRLYLRVGGRGGEGGSGRVFAPGVDSSGSSSFPLSPKTDISKFQFDLESEGHRFFSHCHTVKCHLRQTKLIIYLFICLFVYLVILFTYLPDQS